MKESASEERLNLLEKELDGLTEKLDELDGLKLFLGRVHPEFKKQFPEIIKKLRG